MAVVINEFEVVPGESKPPAQEAQPPEGGSGDKKSPPSEHEIGRLVAHKVSRDERIWAH
jgi:hypothetical protein